MGENYDEALLHVQGRQLRLFSFPFEKGVYSKRKEFAPTRRKFFPFRVDLFSEKIMCRNTNRK